MSEKKLQQEQLNRELANNVVRFESFKEGKFSVCRISVGGIEKVKTHALEGLEKETLDDMVAKYWSIDKMVGIN